MARWLEGGRCATEGQCTAWRKVKPMSSCSNLHVANFLQELGRGREGARTGPNAGT